VALLRLGCRMGRFETLIPWQQAVIVEQQEGLEILFRNLIAHRETPLQVASLVDCANSRFDAWLTQLLMAAKVLRTTGAIGL
jgi:hypothetical protein